MLIILMSVIGAISYYSYSENLVSSAAAKVRDVSRDLGWEIPVGSSEQVFLCRKMFPQRSQMTFQERDDNFCCLQKDANPNVLMVGDSGNLSLFPGLNRYDDYNLLILSASAAAPFYNIRTTEVSDTIRQFNFTLTNQALDYALNDDNIKVVIMSFINGPLITNDNSQFKITDVLNPNNNDAKKIFSESLRGTVKGLLGKGKSVIYVLPNPSLSYDVNSCLNSFRRFRITAGSAQSCRQTSDLARGDKEYREWVADVLKDFHQVKVFDAASFFATRPTVMGLKMGEFFIVTAATYPSVVQMWLHLIFTN